MVVGPRGKVVLNLGAGESTDEVKKQKRIAALSAWKTQSVFKVKPRRDGEGDSFSKTKERLCLRGERTCGDTLD